MMACVDVSYRDDAAVAGCLLFAGWSDAAAVNEIVVVAPVAAAYRPGEFYLRELPPILAVLSQIPADLAPSGAIVVDGYVWLGGAEPGLGARLYTALGAKVPIIGVAKTAWGGRSDDTDPARRAVPVLRGDSAKPLWVTAVGIEAADAAAHLASMHGAHRIPTLLRAVDRLVRRA